MIAEMRRVVMEKEAPRVSFSSLNRLITVLKRVVPECRVAIALASIRLGYSIGGLANTSHTSLLSNRPGQTARQRFHLWRRL